MDKREGEVSRLPFENFFLTVPKNAVGEPFGLSLISGFEKFCMRGLGSVKTSRRKIHSHSAEKFHRATR